MVEHSPESWLIVARHWGRFALQLLMLLAWPVVHYLVTVWQVSDIRPAPGLYVSKVDPYSLDISDRRIFDPWWLVPAFSAVMLFAVPWSPKGCQPGWRLAFFVSRVCAAVVVTLGVLLSLWLGLGDFGPLVQPDASYGCKLAGCWPALPQTMVLTIPALLLAVSLWVLVWFQQRLVWVRALVPAGLWLVSFVTVYLIWDPMMMPIITGPPP